VVDLVRGEFEHDLRDEESRYCGDMYGQSRDQKGTLPCLIESDSQLLWNCVEVWLEFNVAALTVETFVRALGLSARFTVSPCGMRRSLPLHMLQIAR